MISTENFTRLLGLIVVTDYRKYASVYNILMVDLLSFVTYMHDVMHPSINCVRFMV